jgi:hypothetical protein
MALWALNSELSAKITPFPSNTNAQLFEGLQNLTTKNITIATKTPSILANISEGVSLGSAGSEIQKAIELMQSNVVEDQQCLEDLYNNVLLPGFGINKKAEIVNFNPISEPAKLEDNIWEWLNDDEKADWMSKNYPDIALKRTPQAAPLPVAPAEPAPSEGQPAPAEPVPAGNSALANLSIIQINKLQKIAARYTLWQQDPNNPKSLTYEQAKQFLLGYGLTEQEIDAWLVKPEEITE